MDSHFGLAVVSLQNLKIHFNLSAIHLNRPPNPAVRAANNVNVHLDTVGKRCVGWLVGSGCSVHSYFVVQPLHYPRL